MEITSLDYDLARCADCGKDCLDDLVRIGMVPSESLFDSYMPQELTDSHPPSRRLPR